MNQKLRNLIIFAAVALGGGFVGMAIDRLNPPTDPMQGVGVLIWLASPLAANLLLRAFGGDGWGDLGITPKFKTSRQWYGLALLIVPLVTLLCLVGGWLSKAISLSGFAEQGWNSLWIVLGTGFAAAAVKNIFEEFAWRGYLTPRFAALPVHPLLNALLTGWIWAGWHVPYYLYFLDRAELQRHTSLSLPSFLVLAFLVLPFHALAFGELRLISQSVWPSWLLHNLANAISLGLLSGGFIQLAPGTAGVFFSPGTEGILYSLLMGAIGFTLYQRRSRG
ncbi:MAG: CPBP family intramembrane glutamic endopeptidase [Caldilineaceae bacterium]